MNIYLTRIAGLAAAFGFFFISACSTQQYTLDNARETFEGGNHDQALIAVNSLLSESPDNEQLLYFKAYILKNLAADRDQPGSRKHFYTEMKSSLNATADAEDPELTGKRDSLIVSTWQYEQDAGINLLEQTDEIQSENILNQAIAHFENALTVNPDSTSAYRLKATAFYRQGDLQKAVETLQKAELTFDPLPREMEEKLAFLLLEEGHLQQSIMHYQKLRENHPEDVDLQHGLVNAYILDDQHENAIGLLRGLLERDPENYSYHHAAATELFFYIQNSFSELSSGDFNDQEIEDRYELLMKDLEEAEKHYQFVKGNHPDADEIMFITAAFYKNTANQLMIVANTQRNNLSDRLHKKARDLLLRSIPAWEAVAERNPENAEIWKSIYQVYSHLDMKEEAAKAQSNANL
ncbi:MAG: tetratricopeptide repeat protein [Balneolaceae bacterium]